MTKSEKNRKRYVENRQHISMIAKIYRENNRDAINAKQRQRYRSNEQYRNYMLNYQKEYRQLSKNIEE